MIKNEELRPTTLRLPDGLKKWIKIRAIKNNRSFNGEMIEIFEREKEREEVKNEKQNK